MRQAVIIPNMIPATCADGFFRTSIGSNGHRDRLARAAGCRPVADDSETPLSSNRSPADHTHTAQDLSQAGHDVEQMVPARALRMVFKDRVFLCGNRTVIFD